MCIDVFVLLSPVAIKENYLPACRWLPSYPLDDDTALSKENKVSTKKSHGTAHRHGVWNCVVNRRKERSQPLKTTLISYTTLARLSQYCFLSSCTVTQSRRKFLIRFLVSEKG